MQRTLMVSVFAACASLCGCGGATPESKFTKAPHGGNIIELPDSHGFVELTATIPPASKSGQVGQSKSRILAYFYQSDATSPMSPAPTDVKVTLGGDVVTLAPQPSEPGQFASSPGPYADELRGEIAFQVDGKPVEAKFSFR